MVFHSFGFREFRVQKRKIQLIFFNVNKSITLDQRKFFWINKTFFNSKKYFLWPQIKEMFLWFKETVFSVCIHSIPNTINPNFQSESIRIIPPLDSFGLILIENSVWINPSSDWFGLKTWFRFGFFGLVRNDSHWLGYKYRNESE